MNYSRRNFIKTLTASATMTALPGAFKIYSAPIDYTGKLVICIQADGGYDVTSFCDPKTNTPGELDINNWANSNDPVTVGNISYAPVAGNDLFFQKYYQDMLVINGIDAQTNAHSTGIIHNWSGRLAAGFPSITASFSSIQAPELPISYINNGGYGDTAGLIRSTRLNDLSNLSNIIYPNQNIYDSQQRYVNDDTWLLIQNAQNTRREQLTTQENLTPQQTNNRLGFKSAMDNSSLLTDFANQIQSAGELEEALQDGPFSSSLRRQAQISLLAMKSGVSVAADLIQLGFDTHQEHDSIQYWHLEKLTDGIDYLWEYAESLGLANRLVVIINSDFGRTPFYNDSNGKDHWPIGSAIVMERNQNWTNRVVGLTDEVHNAIAIDPITMQSDVNGEIIYPKHVMYNLRRYLGIDAHPNLTTFPLSDAAQFDFFTV